MLVERWGGVGSGFDSIDEAQKRKKESSVFNKHQKAQKRESQELGRYFCFVFIYNNNLFFLRD